jgi:asparagine synthase (glutamine-hydrolysing)
VTLRARWVTLRARWVDAKSSLGDAKSSLGDANSSLGDAKSSLGDAKSSLGDAKSSLGDVQVSSIAVRQLRAKGIDKIMSFTIGIKGAPDLLAAKKVADLLGTDHHEFYFTPQEALDALPEVVYHLESYEQCRAATPMFLLARRIKVRPKGYSDADKVLRIVT